MVVILAIITAIMIWIVFSGKPYAELTEGEKKVRSFWGVVIAALIALTIGSCLFTMPPDRTLEHKPDGAYTF